MPEPPPPPPMPGDATAALQRFQDCMVFADFQSANMAGAWSSLTTNNGSKCAACHVNGGFNFIVTADAQFFFDTLKSNKYYLLEHITVGQTAQGQYQAIVNETTIPAAGSGQAPHTEHPRFNAAAGMTATRNFYNLTQARCAAPG